jgi:hypothetical protein
MSTTVASNGGKGGTLEGVNTENVEGNGTIDLTGGGGDGGGEGGRGPFNLTDQQKRVLLVVLVAHLILAKVTWLDLRRRPAAAVRGPKGMWRTWSLLNTTGSVAYWSIGRRRTAMEG